MDPQAATQVVSKATEAGWIAGLFALIVVGGFAALGLIVRQLWNDHRELNGFVRTKLTETLSGATTAINKLAAVMDDRPCLKDDARQIHDIAKDSKTPVV